MQTLDIRNFGFLVRLLAIAFIASSCKSGDPTTVDTGGTNKNCYGSSAAYVSKNGKKIKVKRKSAFMASSASATGDCGGTGGGGTGIASADCKLTVTPAGGTASSIANTIGIIGPADESVIAGGVKIECESKRNDIVNTWAAGDGATFCAANPTADFVVESKILKTMVDGTTSDLYTTTQTGNCKGSPTGGGNNSGISKIECKVDVSLDSNPTLVTHIMTAGQTINNPSDDNLTKAADWCNLFVLYVNGHYPSDPGPNPAWSCSEKSEQKFTTKGTLVKTKTNGETESVGANTLNGKCGTSAFPASATCRATFNFVGEGDKPATDVLSTDNIISETREPSQVLKGQLIQATPDADGETDFMLRCGRKVIAETLPNACAASTSKRWTNITTVHVKYNKNAFPERDIVIDASSNNPNSPDGHFNCPGESTFELIPSFPDSCIGSTQGKGNKGCSGYPVLNESDSNGWWINSSFEPPSPWVNGQAFVTYFPKWLESQVDQHVVKITLRVEIIWAKENKPHVNILVGDKKFDLARSSGKNVENSARGNLQREYSFDVDTYASNLAVQVYKNDNAFDTVVIKNLRIYGR